MNNKGAIKGVIKGVILGNLASISLLLGITSGAATAQMPEEMQHAAPEPVSQFQQLEQPLWVKAAVTAGGLGLIGLELWWFLWSKPKSRQAATQAGVQEITVTVDGGYEPSQIVVQLGQPVRLNFDRKDPSSCLEEVRFPDFRIAQALPLNQITPIEFTPNQPGRYEFTCGMNMFRGVVEVQPANDLAAVAPSQPTSRPDSVHSEPAARPTHPQAAPTAGVEATMAASGIQEATVTVARGYEPKRIIATVGHPLRLHFDRQNPSSCYDQLLIPAFNVAVDLPPDQTTTVEFTPEQVGEYEFMCGMQMNRGMIEVCAEQQHQKTDRSSFAIS